MHVVYAYVAADPGAAPATVPGTVGCCSMGIKAQHTCVVPFKFVTQRDEGSQ